MYDNVENTIQRVESQMDLTYKTTYLYDPQYFSKNNEDCTMLNHGAQ